VAFERLVLVTRQTEQEALVERFQTRSQAQFYLTQAGHDFGRIRAVHEVYQESLRAVRAAIPTEMKLHVIERRTLPQYRFEPKDVVVTLGQDGVVANVAKYLDGQPLIAVNPDPSTIDGVLLPVQVPAFARVLERTLAGRAEITGVTMAEAKLSDGQVLRAVNDIFVGAASHVSARYRIGLGQRAEEQSSSGVIVSTGVGSTGWLRSIYAGALAIAREVAPGPAEPPAPKPMPWDSEDLVFNVREPWPSLTTGASLVSGRVTRGHTLDVVSRMPEGGVIFGDGMQADYVAFNSGTSAAIGVAASRLRLVIH
jgi:NAD kinase